MLKKPLLIFIVFSSVLAFLFFFFPINLFDGKIVVENGLQSYTADDNLSLSNFIGIGIEGMNEQGIVDQNGRLFAAEKLPAAFSQVIHKSIKE